MRSPIRSLVIILAILVALLFVVLGLVLGALVVIADKDWPDAAQLLYNYKGSLAAVGLGTLALGLAAKTLTQKTISDERNAYYDRVQWAIEMTLDENPVKQSAGWHFLEPMLNSGL
ncbi:MAG: hypothetical protein ACTH7R_10520, partial [Corynebacterium flavescens]|uniref:hypothetical protein n=1 Tax=Corynebacterium flavescens TaxID=28028 RepID=UPI003F93BED1